MACSCGSAACRGRIADIRSIPDAVLERYRNAGGLPRYIMDLISTPDWRSAELPPFEVKALQALSEVTDTGD